MFDFFERIKRNQEREEQEQDPLDNYSGKWAILLVHARGSATSEPVFNSKEAAQQKIDAWDGKPDTIFFMGTSRLVCFGIEVKFMTPVPAGEDDE